MRFDRSDGARWRVAFIFTFGCLAGLLVMPTAQAATGSSVGKAAVQTRAVSCHGYDFVGLDGGSAQNAAFDGVGRTGWGWYGCHLDLPNRATITRVRFSVYDKSTTASVDYCSLWRSPLMATAAHQAQSMADVTETGYPQKPGNIRKTDSTIAHPVIDNLNYVYRLQCEIADGDAIKHTGIYGADVMYTIDLANG
jgi:hypothetical protein